MAVVRNPYMPGNDGPADTAVALTPSDSASVAAFRGVYVGVGGDVSVQTAGDVAVVFKNAIAGMILPVIGQRVNATGTTATNLVALY